MRLTSAWLSLLAVTPELVGARDSYDHTGGEIVTVTKTVTDAGQALTETLWQCSPESVTAFPALDKRYPVAQQTTAAPEVLNSATHMGPEGLTVSVTVGITVWIGLGEETVTETVHDGTTATVVSTTTLGASTVTISPSATPARTVTNTVTVTSPAGGATVTSTVSVGGSTVTVPGSGALTTVVSTIDGSTLTVPKPGSLTTILSTIDGTTVTVPSEPSGTTIVSTLPGTTVTLSEPGEISTVVSTDIISGSGPGTTVTQITTSIFTEPPKTITLPRTTLTLPPSTSIVTRTVSASTITKSGSTVTIQPSTTTSVTTLPGSTFTQEETTTVVSGSIATSVITLPGTTVPGTTVPGTTVSGTTVSIAEPSSIETVSVTVFITLTDTITVPGLTEIVPTTITGFSSINGGTRTSVVTTTVKTCPAITGPNPTYTPASALPTNYLWGCPPGFLCQPSRTSGDRQGCNVEVSLPSDDYVCSPEECIPVPATYQTQNGTVWREEAEFNYHYNVSNTYFNLDPKLFGLNYSTVFNNSNPALHVVQKRTAVRSERRLDSMWSLLTGRKWKRDYDEPIPSNCYNDCSGAAFEGQSEGKSDALCDSGSHFMEALGYCHTCIDHWATLDKNSYSSTMVPQFAPWLDYCNGKTSTSTATSSPTTKTSSSTITTDSSMTIKTTATTETSTKGTIDTSTSGKVTSTTSGATETGVETSQMTDSSGASTVYSSTVYATTSTGPSKTLTYSVTSTQSPPSASGSFLFFTTSTVLLSETWAIGSESTSILGTATLSQHTETDISSPMPADETSASASGSASGNPSNSQSSSPAAPTGVNAAPRANMPDMRSLCMAFLVVALLL